jgi:hypothetical protein
MGFYQPPPNKEKDSFVVALLSTVLLFNVLHFILIVRHVIHILYGR